MTPTVHDLLRAAEPVRFFTSHENRPFALLPEPASRAVPLYSAAFRDWIFAAYEAEHHDLPGSYAYRSLLYLLQARIARNPDQFGRPVYRRIGAHTPDCVPSSILIHRNDHSGTLIDISAHGWHIAHAEVPFESSPAAGAHPDPNPCHDPRPALDALRASLNLATPADWHRCLAWLLSAFRPTGPYPVLILQGPAGSGKTLAARRLRTLVDPATSAIPAPPRGLRDLIGLARRHWVVAFDGAARFTPTVAHALCRLGEGLPASIHEDVRSRGAEPSERTFHRPVLFTVKDGWTCRSDLARRALVVNLAPLESASRRAQADLEHEFQQRLPDTLGALCTVLSTALTNSREMLEPAAGPRCPDALAWAIAASPALGCTREDFIAAFTPPGASDARPAVTPPTPAPVPAPPGLHPLRLAPIAAAVMLLLLPLFALALNVDYSTVPATKPGESARQVPSLRPNSPTQDRPRLPVDTLEPGMSSRFSGAAIVLTIPLLLAAPPVTPSVAVTTTTVAANVGAAVAVLVSGGSLAPTGTITLREDATTLGTSNSISVGGLFTVPVTFPSAGTHTVVAYYSGDANYAAAQSAPAKVQAVSTSVALTGTGPSGLVFAIRATIFGPGPCAGTVSFTEAGKPLYSGTLQAGAGALEFQALQNPQVGEGPHTFTAAFAPSGPACGPAVSTPLSVYVGIPPSTTEIVSVTPNPSLFGQLPEVVVRVRTAIGTAAGRVAIWYRGGTIPSILAQGDLDPTGSIHLILPSQPIGSWPLTAEYAGSPTAKAGVSAPFHVIVQPAIAFVSAASGHKSIAPGSLASAFGMGIAPATVKASSLPLPTDLGGVQLLIPDSAGTIQKAPLLFVNSNQVNFLVPSNVRTGPVTIEVRSAGQTFSAMAQIDKVAPAVFTPDSSGSGAPVGTLITLHRDGSLDSRAAYQCNSAGCGTAELDLGADTDENVLVLYATGFRNATDQELTARVGSFPVPVLYAGPQAEFAGLDQVNLQLPRSLAGSGEVPVEITAGGKQANIVRIRLH